MRWAVQRATASFNRSICPISRNDFSPPWFKGDPFDAAARRQRSAHDGGAGWNCRVARLSLLALAGRAGLRGFAVEDDRRHRVGTVDIMPFHGRRMRFAVAKVMARARRRQHIVRLRRHGACASAGLRWRSRYAVWVHGVDLWDRANLRADYVAAVKGADLVLGETATIAGADGRHDRRARRPRMCAGSPPSRIFPRRGHRTRARRSCCSSGAPTNCSARARIF